MVGALAALVATGVGPACCQLRLKASFGGQKATSKPKSARLFGEILLWNSVFCGPDPRNPSAGIFCRGDARPTRPPVPCELQAPARQRAVANRSWGEERIANELLLELWRVHYNRGRPHWRSDPKSRNRRLTCRCARNSTNTLFPSNSTWSPVPCWADFTVSTVSN